MRRPHRRRVTGLRQAQTQNRDRHVPGPQRMLPLCGARDRQRMQCVAGTASGLRVLLFKLLSLPTWFFYLVGCQWGGGLTCQLHTTVAAILYGILYQPIPFYTAFQLREFLIHVTTCTNLKFHSGVRSTGPRVKNLRAIILTACRYVSGLRHTIFDIACERQRLCN